ncbi:F-box protein [Heracleum sosnowskyi]|uniref:F-box protein n=1 Tax=Heracleum sosnowskyi TaxID=360622 RepID=A0AAD8J565_9APIA|nr:F-box protein [Heracleum sosnowskyi]
MDTEMMTYMLPWLLESLSLLFIYWFKRSRGGVSFLKFPMLYIEELEEKNSLLDLPELALDSILKKLSPADLSKMSGVCTTLRDMCTSDHLWERHMKRKWGGLIGNFTYKESQWSLASRKLDLECPKKNGLVTFFSCRKSDRRGKMSTLAKKKRGKMSSTLPVDSVMALYLSLETGKLWFPAQVFNRENGYVGFLLSCYDAELSYDRHWCNFRARFSSGRRPTMEHNIDWNRLRAPAVESGPHTLHPSDCLDDLKPGDHFEIQWKRETKHPYGWWFGVVGHLEPVNRCKIYCQCLRSDKVMLEFKQYDPGSQWRETTIWRKNHCEIGDGINGYYGGIRKISNKHEILMWQQHWPTEAMLQL